MIILVAPFTLCFPLEFTSFLLCFNLSFCWSVPSFRLNLDF